MQMLERMLVSVARPRGRRRQGYHRAPCLAMFASHARCPPSLTPEGRLLKPPPLHDMRGLRVFRAGTGERRSGAWGDAVERGVAAVHEERDTSLREPRAEARAVALPAERDRGWRRPVPAIRNLDLQGWRDPASHCVERWGPDAGFGGASCAGTKRGNAGHARRGWRRLYAHADRARQCVVLPKEFAAALGYIPIGSNCAAPRG